MLIMENKYKNNISQINKLAILLYYQKYCSYSVKLFIRCMELSKK